MKIHNATGSAVDFLAEDQGLSVLDQVREAAQWAIEKQSFRRPVVGEAAAYHPIKNGERATYIAVSNGAVKEEGAAVLFDNLPLTDNFDELSQVVAAEQAAGRFVSFCISLAAEGKSLIWRKEPELSAYLTDGGLQFVFYARLAWVD